MTDLEKAKRFLDSELSLGIMATKSSVPKSSLSEFKSGKRDLNTAQYETVKRMANAYNRENDKKISNYRKEAIDFIAQQVTVSDIRNHVTKILEASTTPNEIANAIDMISFYLVESYRSDEVMVELRYLVKKGTLWN